MIAQIFGMTFIGVIAICLIWTVAESIFTREDKNKKLLKNMEKLDRNKTKY